MSIYIEQINKTRSKNIESMQEAKAEMERQLRSIHEEIKENRCADLGAAEVQIHEILEQRGELAERLDKEIALEKVNSGSAQARTIEKHDSLGGLDYTSRQERTEKMENEIKVRSFQKYITTGIKTMSDIEQRALDLSGSAAIMPVDIMNKLITAEAYSDLLHRATVIEQGGAASVQVPIASNTAASWKLEVSDVDGDSNTYEASPTLTKLDLKGYELYRWLRMSAASAVMSENSFTDLMLQLLSSEVIETLEKSFITGTGTGQPKGLDELTWGVTNQITTADSTTPIEAADIAKGFGLLAQKYSRGCVVMCNADTLYNTISLQKGTNEYAFSMADGATRFMGKEIIVNEHVSDDVVYIVNPKELYVRFAAPLQIESNRSSGFTSASVDLRALAVVDAAWNPAACIQVTIGEVS